jgi:hypothetical protein
MEEENQELFRNTPWRLFWLLAQRGASNQSASLDVYTARPVVSSCPPDLL